MNVQALETDYLVVGESPGSKLAAAERLGTQVLDETRFVEFLANPPYIIERTGETEGSSS